jgi:hypothetical protein
MRDKAGAGCVSRIKEFTLRAIQIPLACLEVVLILLRQEGRLVVIEPPGNTGRGRVFEIDDGILIAGKLAFVKERARAMNQPVILIFR